MIMLTHLRMVSYAPIFRQRYAEDHTDKVVSRDVESLQAVPLPAVAMDLCIFWVYALIYISLGMNGLRYFKNHWTDSIIYIVRIKYCSPQQITGGRVFIIWKAYPLRKASTAKGALSCNRA